MTAWEKYCLLRGDQPVPASPTMIARFIAELSPLGIDQVWRAVLEISRAHYCIGLPDPTNSAPVVTEMNRLSGIKPPASWPDEEKARFLTLPYDVQSWLAKKADMDRKEMRRVHDELAQLKKERTNGTHAAEATDRQNAAA